MKSDNQLLYQSMLFKQKMHLIHNLIMIFRNVLSLRASGPGENSSVIGCVRVHVLSQVASRPECFLAEVARKNYPI